MVISLPEFINIFFSSVLSSILVMRERLSGTAAVRCVGYGHVGDGNMHLNVTTREFDAEVAGLIEPFLYEWTSQHGGSISAEHGHYLSHTICLT